MTSSSSEDVKNPDVTPVWARDGVFPSKSSGADFGFIDSKGGEQSASSAEELAEKIDGSRAGIHLVWTPESDQLVVPESVPALHKVLRRRQGKFADHDASDGKRMSLVFGLAVLWTGYKVWENHGKSWHAIYSSQLTGLAALLLLIFGLLPLYESWKTRRRLAGSKPADMAKEIPEAQFDAWLESCKVPVTYGLLVCLGLVGLVQLCIDGWSSTGVKSSILQAGLLKLQALNHPELADGAARWRIFTAPLLHGNIIHLAMNASGILYLGRRTESLARWPHLVIVFVISAWIGGVASFYWIPDKIAVGASGGLLGLLGFMLVFEKMHPRLVPKPAQRRLLAGVLLMVMIGFLGMSFIDNAAHAGGLLAGMAYAGIVFPKSASFHRPQTITKDKIVGGLMVIAVLGATFWTIYQLMD